MASRSAVRRELRNVDYSAIGKLGRRTGVTLDYRPLDANGMEEISGIFSSPRKPSPLKNVMLGDRPLHCDHTNTTAGSGSAPRQVHSSPRRSRTTPIRPARSSSPRKSGVSGTARKSNGVNIFSTRKGLQHEDIGDSENIPEPTPTRTLPNLQTRNFSPSPQRPPLRDITAPLLSKTPKGRASLAMQRIENEVYPSTEDDDSDPDRMTEEIVTVLNDASLVPSAKTTEVPAANAERQASTEFDDPDVEFDGEEADQDQEPNQPVSEVTRNRANSRKKRKSDVFEDDDNALSPLRIGTQKDTTPLHSRKKRKSELLEEDANALSPLPIPTQKDTSPLHSSSNNTGLKANNQPLKNKKMSLKLSSQQQKELEEIVERVKARPGPPRSLYILRRETPTDDNVSRTRSGRVTVKPLAYWRNERCVYGASPHGRSLADGARFPLNSIKEIVRTEEIEPNIGKKKSKTKKRNGKVKAMGKARQKSVEDSDSSSDFDMDEIPEDPDAEPWETGTGTLRGNVSIWDNEEQAPTEQEEEVEIAHAPAAIQTREAGGSRHGGPTFRYAKLLSTSFFGTGLVDLPPGGVKRPKNSRHMHMSFFVVKGRVTVTVGPEGGEETGSTTRFSIGKGGFWQVPRGNRYSIENEMEKPARIFFSQGREPGPTEELA
ncbi:uncharacterized protein Z519_06860 [Cladophialophora bantiana CBS 173.52]|uniref:CENP-C homolog n=1 Tax=Cladophialophora bantiana (strain ATCC 10958 / CBS 173.52 / CDC B-1940 / NIH 8579) TaxID=1442370 RepID=A0A0D2ET32_CLAB1|nr:uncharacterized protein Z519_06860 [Cladophialophora bantiana CBS 173.52]KIW93011.1 hypothetical protein Z519_06860 [Cladophialophora bantiana CBS 173.52]